MIKLDDAYHTDNIFAKILRGELPSIRLYEDAETLSFMDIMPQVPGHVLVIPKTPATNILTLPEPAGAALMRTVQIMSRAVQVAMDAPGLLIAQLNGSAAGQTVPHIHMHILPRHDGLELAFHAREPADPSELEEIAKKIRAAL